MKIKNVIILFTSFLLCLFVLTSTANTRCSKIGVYILDDIFGLNGVESSCKSEYPNRIYDDVPPQGKIKFTNFNNNLSYKVKRACPKNKSVILIVGQSNAANSGLSLIKEDKKNLNFNPADNFCYELSEPVLGADGTIGDSITSSIGKKIKIKDEVIFLNISVAGSTINEWVEWYGSDVNESLKFILNENYLKASVWMQGEAEDLKSSKNYFDKFRSLKDIMFKDLQNQFENSLFIITRSTICANRENQEIINLEMEKQRQKIKKKFKNIELLKITDTLDKTYRHDGCHFNRKGIDKISSIIANKINYN